MRHSKGQVEAEIAEAITRFEKEYMGRGPTETRAILLDDLVLVRLHGLLTPAELHLMRGENPQESRRLIKQMRMELVEGARPLLASVITDITGRTVISMHTDISTTTGERMIIFVLDGKTGFDDQGK